MSTPNEVYRKDLVSAMTVTDLPDCHQFFYLADNWKTEWERGVQVPAKAKQKKAHVRHSLTELVVHSFVGC
jgi:hypothetical protein